MQLTEKYFKTTSWPPADAIASLVNNGSLQFLHAWRFTRD
jgi:hypothetical protein